MSTYLDDTDLPDTDPFLALRRAGDLPDDTATTDAVLAARAAVRRAATTETLHAKVTDVRRRRRLGVRAAVDAAGLVAASLVVGGVVLDPDDGRPTVVSAEAAVVLERAAQTALAESDPVVGPGQYLKLTTVQESWAESSDSKGKVLVGNDGKPVASQTRWTRSIWVPYDVDADWTFSEETELLRENSADPRYHLEPQPWENRTWTDTSWAKDDGGNRLETYDPDWYASLSRDPETLMQQILEGDSSEGSGSAYRFEEVHSEILRSGLAPADVRAALFRGLADLPGMVVTEGVSALGGREGVALGAADSHFRMVFDAETGAYIGARATDPDFPDDVDGLDADRATFLASYTVEVVDSAPEAEPAD